LLRTAHLLEAGTLRIPLVRGIEQGHVHRSHEPAGSRKGTLPPESLDQGPIGIAGEQVRGGPAFQIRHWRQRRHGLEQTLGRGAPKPRCGRPQVWEEKAELDDRRRSPEFDRRIFFEHEARILHDEIGQDSATLESIEALDLKPQRVRVPLR